MWFEFTIIIIITHVTYMLWALLLQGIASSSKRQPKKPVSCLLNRCCCCDIYNVSNIKILLIINITNKYAKILILTENEEDAENLRLSDSLIYRYRYTQKKNLCCWYFLISKRDKLKTSVCLFCTRLVQHKKRLTHAIMFHWLFCLLRVLFSSSLLLPIYISS